MSMTPITVPNSSQSVVWAPLVSLSSIGVIAIDLKRFSGMLPFETRGDGPHLRASVLDSNVLLEPAHDEVVVPAAVLVDRNQRARHPDVGRPWIRKARRSDTNDLGRLSDGLDRLPDRRVSVTELTDRPGVAHDSERSSLLRLGPHAPAERSNAKDTEEIGRHELNRMRTMGVPLATTLTSLPA